MRMQVLVTTMNLKNPEDLLCSLNLSTPFVIGNQSDNNIIETYSFRGNQGLIVSRKEKGVGKNRNVTLNYAEEDICILSDDDMRFVDNYPDIVKEAFEQFPKADVLIFNLDNAGKERRQNTKAKKLNRFNYMNYGAARMAFKRKVVSYFGITFNTNFGGGTQHCAGEDVLFIGECIKKGLKVYAIPATIATLLDNRQSTWFEGYNEKYFFDKGVFLSIADNMLAKLFALYLTLRHREYRSEELSILQVYRQICSGIRYINKKEYL